MFAIPAAVAVLALWFNHRYGGQVPANQRIVAASLVGAAGLLLQGAGQEAVVLARRCLFGWALFEATVRLDQRLFELSTTEAYAREFGKVSFFQNLGVLAASFTAGTLVSVADLAAPFWLAAGGFVVSALLYGLLFRPATDRAACRAAARAPA